MPVGRGAARQSASGKAASSVTSAAHCAEQRGTDVVSHLGQFQDVNMRSAQLF